MTIEGDTSEELGADYTRFFEVGGRHLLRLAYLLTGNSADAEDVTQEVLEELYRKWDQVRPDTAMAYARTAVINRSRSLHRRKAVARRFALRLVQPDHTAPAAVENGWLWDMVQTLPQRQREVVVLRYWCDLAEADIARVLGISTGTVKSSAHRAHTQLAAALADSGTAVTSSRKDVQ